MSTLNGFSKRTKKRVKEIHEELASLANEKLLHTKIAATYGIEHYLKAYEHIDMKGKDRDGKIVLLPNK
jgi:NADPH:quinone reductase-like Zn-dependent oxidoreductase